MFLFPAIFKFSGWKSSAASVFLYRATRTFPASKINLSWHLMMIMAGSNHFRRRHTPFSYPRPAPCPSLITQRINQRHERCYKFQMLASTSRRAKQTATSDSQSCSPAPGDFNLSALGEWCLQVDEPSLFGNCFVSRIPVGILKHRYLHTEGFCTLCALCELLLVPLVTGSDSLRSYSVSHSKSRTVFGCH